MWHIDICGEGYNPDLKRRLRVREGYYPLMKGKSLEIYTVVEEWFTPASIGNTSDFYYFTFSTKLEACTFIGELVMKFNSPWQQVLFRAAEKLFAVSLNAACDEIDKDRRERGKKQQRGIVGKLTPTKTVPSSPSAKHVYAFDMGNGTVKIGVSIDVGRRRQDISNSSGMEIARWCYTEAVRDFIAYKNESECHAFFAPYRTRGEFFRIPFAEAHAKLQTYGKVFDEHI